MCSPEVTAYECAQNETEYARINLAGASITATSHLYNPESDEKTHVVIPGTNCKCFDVILSILEEGCESIGENSLAHPHAHSGIKEK